MILKSEKNRMDSEFRESLKEQVKVIDISDEDYPDKLRRIDKPPKKLFCLGDISLLKSQSLGVVGSRKASEYGKQVALKIGEKAGRYGITIVSGMAKGIDGFSHRGALISAGKTIAVLGCGCNICYPKDNFKLYKDIIHNGLIISEYEIDVEPRPFRFPERNRIISALSDALVVVEAGTNSGSLITAELAATQGKEVFSVPGNITAHFSLGTNKLISDGARIVTVIDDIFIEGGFNSLNATEDEIKLAPREKEIYDIIYQFGETSIDHLCSIMDKSVVEINGIIGVLEIKGLISYSYGKVFLAKF